MKVKSIVIIFLFQTINAFISFAHPGSGIAVSQDGRIYFTDTGKGIWEISGDGKLTYLPSSRFHWMTLDPSDRYNSTAGNFGGDFEAVQPAHSKFKLIQCSDFPLTCDSAGNVYYVDTRPAEAKIIRRTPDGKQSIVACNKILQHAGGIAMGAQRTLYISESSNAAANTVTKVTMDGRISVMATYAGAPGVECPLETLPAYCRGLDVNASGTVYVAATGSRAVLKISKQGTISTILQVQKPWSPTGIAVRKGIIYVLEWHDVNRENLEVRTAYIPRVRKLEGSRVSTIATVSR
jgi:hypothetical protein